jgi:hypothetical protein
MHGSYSGGRPNATGLGKSASSKSLAQSLALGELILAPFHIAPALHPQQQSGCPSQTLGGYTVRVSQSARESPLVDYASSCRILP